MKSNLLFSSTLLVAFISAFLFGTGCQKAADNKEASLSKTFTITNTLDASITDGQVIISNDKLKEIVGEFDPQLFPLISVSGQTVPSQIDDLDADGTWDELAFIYDFKENEALKFEVTFISKDSVPEFKAYTNTHLGRRDNEEDKVTPRAEVTFGNQHPSWQPNQMDGPAWENDKVGFRMYFDGRNARDYFCKRTPEIVLPTVGLDSNSQPVDNYHVLEDWGRDVLSVGNSLGCGGIALKTDEKIIRLGLTRPDSIDNVKSSSYKEVSKGPIRAIFQLVYEGWKTPAGELKVTEFVSIWKGSYAYKTEVKVEGFEGNKELVVGMVNSNNDLPETKLEINSMKTLITHDHQTYNKEMILGLGLAVPSQGFIEWNQTANEGPGLTTTSYAAMSIEAGKSVSYYVFGACELENDKWKDPVAFISMVEKELKQIGALKVE